MASKGSTQHKAEKPIRYDWDVTYGRALEDLDLASQEFRFTAIRPDIFNAPLDDYLEQITWRDEGNQYNLNTIPVLRGTAMWRQEHDDLPGGTFHLRDGHSIRCEVKWLGHWLPLWQMRIVKPPETTVESGEANAELADDLYLASLSRGHFRFRKSKKRPRGWRYHEIVVNVCRRYHIPLAAIQKGTAWIKELGDGGDLDDVSPLEVIRQAVLAEQTYTGRRLLIAWRWDTAKKRFALHVIPAARNNVLWTFSDEIRNATVSPVRRATLATSVVAHGSGKKPKHGKRVHYKPVRISSDKAIRQYGFIERHVTVSGNAEGRGDLVAKAKRELTKQLKPVRIISNFQTGGIATVRRGDTIRVSLPQQGFMGDAGIVYVTTVEHTVTPGDYTMTLELTWRDPLDPNVLRKQREDALKRRKQRERSKHKKAK
jgi:hypothetical protein